MNTDDTRKRPDDQCDGFASLPIDAGRLIIYDPRHRDAWLRSDYVLPVRR